MQKAMNRLFTLILALSLVGGGMATMSLPARADVAPGQSDPPPGPDENTGDPDWPDGGAAKTPRSGPPRGSMNPGYRSITIDRPGYGAKWMWGFRTAFTILYRSFFRF